MKIQRTMNRLDFRIIPGFIGAAVLSATLSACGTTPPATVESKKIPAADMSGKLLLLQRQIQEKDRLIEERDKRIEELESQLDALKLIEQDRENQRKPVRPPPTLLPRQ
jgi:septal ring factor EnvC (AmiA/AmiB activator)